MSFPPPLRPAARPRTVLRPGRVERRMALDIGSGRLESTVLRDDGCSRIDAIGVETDHLKELRYEIRSGDPAAARAETHTTLINRHPGWDTRIAARTAISCDRETFHVEAELEAFEDGRRVFSRSWTLPVRRRGN